MSIIKQLATYDGSTWKTDDIGANASNISLTTNVAGQTNVQSALSKICGTTALTGSRAVTTNSNGVLTTSAVTSTELGYLSGATSNIQTQINNIINYNKYGLDPLYFYPTYQSSPKTSLGCIWTLHTENDFYISATGTPTGESYFTVVSRTNSHRILTPGTYKITGCPAGGSISTYYIQVNTTINGNPRGIAWDTGNGYTFTITLNTVIGVNLIIQPATGTVNNLIFRPRLTSLASISDLEDNISTVLNTINGKITTLQTELNNSIDALETTVGNIIPTIDSYNTGSEVSSEIYNTEYPYRSIVKYGYVSSLANKITFREPFPHHCYTVVASPLTTTSNLNQVVIKNRDASGFEAVIRYVTSGSTNIGETTTGVVYWIAFGF